MVQPGLPPGHSDTGASNGAGFDSTWGWSLSNTAIIWWL
jgi:hypothetical protein